MQYLARNRDRLRLKARYIFGDEFLIGIVSRHPAETPGFRWLRIPRRGEGERRH